MSLIGEMREGPAAHPGLALKFEQAKEALLRETKNYRLDTPYEVANYNARVLMEHDVWYLDDYLEVMEGENACKKPLSMQECADGAEESMTGSLKVSGFCMEFL